MPPPTRHELRTAGGTLRLGEAPLLMGIVNASPDSFSDGGVRRTLDQRVELAAALLEAGAGIIDVGGESGVTHAPAVDPEVEIRRVAPLVERIAGGLGAVVSVDTYKPAVARAAIEAGAAIVNDVSGLRDPELARVCAATGAGLVLMHTYAPPKRKLLDSANDGRVAHDVASFLEERIALARREGMAVEQVLLDPGPDFGKTPSQTIEALRGLDGVLALGRPVLMAISRKDFVGAITGRAPRERGAGTLAALAWGVERGAHVFRVHDVAAAADFLAVRAVLSGERELDRSTRLAEGLRREPPAARRLTML